MGPSISRLHLGLDKRARIESTRNLTVGYGEADVCDSILRSGRDLGEVRLEVDGEGFLRGGDWSRSISACGGSPDYCRGKKSSAEIDLIRDEIIDWGRHCGSTWEQGQVR